MRALVAAPIWLHCISLLGSNCKSSGPCSATPFAAALGGKKGVNWDKLDLQELERSWEEGDDEEELRTEGELREELLERAREERRREGGGVDREFLGSLDPRDAEIFLRAAQRDFTGPTMMFVSLKEPEKESHEPQLEDGAEGDAITLGEMARACGYQVSTYAVDADTVILSTQKSWEGRDILECILNYGRLERVKWNDVWFSSPPVGRDSDEL